LRDAAGRIEPALNKELKATFGTSIEINRADEVIKAICADQEWRDMDADQAQAL
ncbi:hypothetical protein HTZ97_16210, partial [Desulfuromonas acetoxidans]|nr:hypothetical protein [Desulfuromonas acetoxidans]NVE18001.1 hypothetical protein [Desulfuromonas acetoxidans]